MHNYQPGVLCNIHKRDTSMPPAEFETVVPRSERPHTQTYASGRTATEIDICIDLLNVKYQRDLFLQYIHNRKKFPTT
jgi:hypothetical protein